jgi:predicted ATP-binding protein involved in virulence
MNIMDYLSERFPKTQFIVTAHSPLIVQSASDANVIMLERKGNQVLASTNTFSIKGWRIDQILGSDLFGSLNSRSTEVQDKIKRRKELTLQTRLSAQEKKELSQLDSEVEAWPTAESPEMIQAMEFVRQAAQQLKK